MRRKLSQVGAGLRVAGGQLEGVLEVGTGSGGFPGAGFEDAKVIPAIGIGRLETERLGLLFDRRLQLAGCSQYLGKKRMQVGVAGRQRDGLAQLG